MSQEEQVIQVYETAGSEADEHFVPKTPIIIISREHKLLPLAHRLQNIEAWPTEVVVWKKSYERAWQGMVEKTVLASEKGISRESVTEWIKRVAKGELVAVHNVPSLENSFRISKSFPVLSQLSSSSSVRLGLWWDGRKAQLPHLLVYDMGAWPGGKGRLVPGGLTLIKVKGANLELWNNLFKAAQIDPDFKGLVNVGLVEEKGQLVFEGWEFGWPDLHTQVFMSAVEGSWGELLTNGKLPKFTSKFTVGLPLSVPPWPGSSSKHRGVGVKDIEIDLNPKLHEYVYWHDVSIDTEAKKLLTCGLDGLVGIVHASSDSFENALQKVLVIAQTIGLPEKQYRNDIGQGVRLLESQLFENYGVSF